MNRSVWHGVIRKGWSPPLADIKDFLSIDFQYNCQLVQGLFFNGKNAKYRFSKREKKSSQCMVKQRKRRKRYSSQSSSSRRPRPRRSPLSCLNPLGPSPLQCTSRTDRRRAR
ncbi:hypothetical protein VTI28DRAFT_8655 [Corynascus sepedonium]